MIRLHLARPAALALVLSAIGSPLWSAFQASQAFEHLCRASALARPEVMRVLSFTETPEEPSEPRRGYGEAVILGAESGESLRNPFVCEGTSHAANVSMLTMDPTSPEWSDEASLRAYYDEQGRGHAANAELAEQIEELKRRQRETAPKRQARVEEWHRSRYLPAIRAFNEELQDYHRALMAFRGSQGQSRRNRNALIDACTELESGIASAASSLTSVPDPSLGDSLRSLLAHYQQMARDCQTERFFSMEGARERAEKRFGHWRAKLARYELAP